MNHNFKYNQKPTPMQRSSTTSTNTDMFSELTNMDRGSGNYSNSMNMAGFGHFGKPSCTTELKTNTKATTKTKNTSTGIKTGSLHSSSDGSSNVNGSMLSSEWVLFSPSLKNDDQIDSSTTTKRNNNNLVENESDVLSSLLSHSYSDGDHDGDRINLVLNNESLLLSGENPNTDYDELVSKTHYNDFNLTGLRTKYYSSAFDEFVKDGNYLFLNRSSYLSPTQSSIQSDVDEDENENEEDDDEDDDLIDDITHISREVYTNDAVNDNVSELNSRIEDWRRDQINSLIKDLQHNSKSDSSMNLDILKSWGIVDDDLAIQYGVHNSSFKTTSPEDRANKIIKQQSQSDDSHIFGDSLLCKYNETELELIKQILKKLSGSLTRKNVLHNNKNSVKRRKTSKRFEAGRFMNNPELQKYIPLYLKNLIVTSNLYHQFSDDDVTDNESISTVHDDSITDPGFIANNIARSGNGGSITNRGVDAIGNFWEINESVNSSILTYSTGSILGF